LPEKARVLVLEEAKEEGVTEEEGRGRGESENKKRRRRMGRGGERESAKNRGERVKK
jgi:hypothetical protein